jgi:predicted regulator of Ras-like GTPase activity (Roadblock/LC7/MglB family)
LGDRVVLSKAEALTKKVMELSGGILGVEAAVLETYEGLVLASTLPTSTEEEIIAAVSSATQSIVNRAVKELKHGDIQNTLVLSSLGQIILTDIEGKALLTVIAKRDANIGLISVMSRHIAGDIKELLPY